MSTVIKLKRSETLNTIPTTSDIEVGEVAVNTADKKIYIRDSSNNIVAVADKNITYSKYNSNTTITSNTGVIADTSSASFTITLPASPSTGDKIEIVDGSGTFGTNPLIVARNGNKIADITDDLSLNITGVAATFIYNTDTWEVYAQIGANSGGSVTLSGSQTLTNKSISGFSNTLTNIENSSLTNSSITLVDDSSTASTISLGETLKIAGGSGVDTSISGDTLTISLESTVVTETSTDTLTNKIISGSDNTITNISNSSLTNSSITIADDSSSTSSVSLGQTLKIIGGTGVDTSVSGNIVTISTSSIPNSSLSNSSVTINGTSVSLGSSGTVTAAAGTLTGSTLASGVTSSSLTSVGTLTNLTVAGAASVTNNSATDKYINLGTRGQIFDDGNLHLHTSSGQLWINSLDGSDIALGLQSNSGTSGVQANSIKMNAGYGSIAPIYGVRAWISCGYVGGNMVTNGSGNLSVSRSNTGKYDFTFGTAMPDGNYCVTATAKTPVDNSDIAANLGYNISTSTTGFSIHTARYGSGFVDVTQLCVQVVR